jgi:hypothetical protein
VEQFGSLILVMSRDPAFAAELGRWLAPFGWDCKASTFDEPAGDRPLAVVIDTRDVAAGEAVAMVRDWPSPASSTPVITAGPAGDLAFPLDEGAFLARLRQAAGPLVDHEFRREPWNFRYRLVRLLGLDAADAMLLRLRSALEEAVADPAAAPAHRLAGIAGLCGFPDLAAAWSRVDRHEDGALEPAVAATRRAVDQLGRAPGT